MRASHQQHSCRRCESRAPRSYTTTVQLQFDARLVTGPGGSTSSAHTANAALNSAPIGQSDIRAAARSMYARASKGVVGCGISPSKYFDRRTFSTSLKMGFGTATPSELRFLIQPKARLVELQSVFSVGNRICDACPTRQETTGSPSSYFPHQIAAAAPRLNRTPHRWMSHDRYKLRYLL
jgi:hypothetical protein